MRKVFFRFLLPALFAGILATSCNKFDDESKVWTAAEEIQLREVYLDSMMARGNDIDTTENGVYYIVFEEGEGDFAKSGDTLTVEYSGFFMHGTIFDTSDYHNEDGVVDFVLDVDPMIAGWKEGLKLMKKNTEILLIIPSEMAYGSQGYLSIPPYQTLLFLIKLYDIKN